MGRFDVIVRTLAGDAYPSWNGIGSLAESARVAARENVGMTLS
jgi:hypothetical protein